MVHIKQNMKMINVISDKIKIKVYLGEIFFVLFFKWGERNE